MADKWLRKLENWECDFGEYRDIYPYAGVSDSAISPLCSEQGIMEKVWH